MLSADHLICGHTMIIGFIVIDDIFVEIPFLLNKTPKNLNFSIGFRLITSTVTVFSLLILAPDISPTH